MKRALASGTFHQINGNGELLRQIPGSDLLSVPLWLRGEKLFGL
jgi:hypothetical protein